MTDTESSESDSEAFRPSRRHRRQPRSSNVLVKLVIRDSSSSSNSSSSTGSSVTRQSKRRRQKLASSSSSSSCSEPVGHRRKRAPGNRVRSDDSSESSSDGSWKPNSERRAAAAAAANDDPQPSTSAAARRNDALAAAAASAASAAATTSAAAAAAVAVAATYSHSSASGSSSSGDDENGPDRCPICLLSLRDQPIGIPDACDHSYCLQCIEEWARNVQTCPVDRLPFAAINCHERGQFQRRIAVEARTTELQLPDDDDQDLTRCELCSATDREESMLLCDNCNRGYHMDCLRPRLTQIPANAWYCDNCFSESDGSSVEDASTIRELLQEMQHIGVPESRLRVRRVSEQAAATPRIVRTRQSERIRASILSRIAPSRRHAPAGAQQSALGMPLPEPTTRHHRHSSRTTTQTTTTTTTTRRTTRRRTTRRSRKRRTTSASQRTYVIEFDSKEDGQKFPLQTKRVTRKRTTAKRKRKTTKRGPSRRRPAAGCSRRTAAAASLNRSGENDGSQALSVGAAAGGSGGGGGRLGAAEMVMPRLHLFGNPNALEYFSDDEDADALMEAAMSGDNENSGRGLGGSDGGLAFAASFARSRIAGAGTLRRQKRVQSALNAGAATAPAESAPDLLSSIMGTMDRWHDMSGPKRVDKVRIDSEGRLSVAGADAAAEAAAARRRRTPVEEAAPPTESPTPVPGLPDIMTAPRYPRGGRGGGGGAGNRYQGNGGGGGGNSGGQFRGNMSGNSSSAAMNGGGGGSGMSFSIFGPRNVGGAPMGGGAGGGGNAGNDGAASNPFIDFSPNNQRNNRDRNQQQQQQQQPFRSSGANINSNAFNTAQRFQNPHNICDNSFPNSAPNNNHAMNSGLYDDPCLPAPMIATTAPPPLNMPMTALPAPMMNQLPPPLMHMVLAPPPPFVPLQPPGFAPTFAQPMPPFGIPATTMYSDPIAASFAPASAVAADVAPSVTVSDQYDPTVDSEEPEDADVGSEAPGANDTLDIPLPVNEAPASTASTATATSGVMRISSYGGDGDDDEDDDDDDDDSDDCPNFAVYSAASMDVARNLSGANDPKANNVPNNPGELELERDEDLVQLDDDDDDDEVVANAEQPTVEQTAEEEDKSTTKKNILDLHDDSDWEELANDRSGEADDVLQVQKSPDDSTAEKNDDESKDGRSADRQKSNDTRNERSFTPCLDEPVPSTSDAADEPGGDKKSVDRRSNASDTELSDSGSDDDGNPSGIAGMQTELISDEDGEDVLDGRSPRNRRARRTGRDDKQQQQQPRRPAADNRPDEPRKPRSGGTGEDRDKTAAAAKKSDRDEAFKKLSRSNKDRNYRDKKDDAKRGSSPSRRRRSRSRSRSHNKENRSRGAHKRDSSAGRRRDSNKRKDMERYDVRNVIAERQPRTHKDKYGRDTSRPRSRSAAARHRGRRGVDGAGSRSRSRSPAHGGNAGAGRSSRSPRGADRRRRQPAASPQRRVSHSPPHRRRAASRSPSHNHSHHVNGGKAPKSSTSHRNRHKSSPPPPQQRPPASRTVSPTVAPKPSSSSRHRPVSGRHSPPRPEQPRSRSRSRSVGKSTRKKSSKRSKTRKRKASVDPTDQSDSLHHHHHKHQPLHHQHHDADHHAAAHVSKPSFDNRSRSPSWDNLPQQQQQQPTTTAGAVDAWGDVVEATDRLSPWTRSPTPVSHDDEAGLSQSWTPPPVLLPVPMSSGAVVKPTGQNLTVILKNKDSAVGGSNSNSKRSSKKLKRRREEKKRDKETSDSGRRERRKKRAKSRDLLVSGTTAKSSNSTAIGSGGAGGSIGAGGAGLIPSKEVFASGDNILVSVSFNKDTTGKSTGSSSRTQQTTIVTMPASKDLIGSRKTETSALAKSTSASGTASRRSRKSATAMATHKRHKKVDLKPVAIIDLDRSPFQEIIPSPRAVIVLDSDSDRDDDVELSSVGRARSQTPPMPTATAAAAAPSSGSERRGPMPEHVSQPQSPNADSEFDDLGASGPKTPPEPTDGGLAGSPLPPTTAAATTTATNQPTSAAAAPSSLVKFSLPLKNKLRITNPLHEPIEEEPLQQQAQQPAAMQPQSPPGSSSSSNSNTLPAPAIIDAAAHVSPTIASPTADGECSAPATSIATATVIDNAPSKIQPTAGSPQLQPATSVSANKIGPNTPPESGPCSPDAYNPFEPTESATASPQHRHQSGRSSQQDDRMAAADGNDDHLNHGRPDSHTPPSLAPLACGSGNINNNLNPAHGLTSAADKSVKAADLAMALLRSNSAAHELQCESEPAADVQSIDDDDEAGDNNDASSISHAVDDDDDDVVMLPHIDAADESDAGHGGHRGRRGPSRHLQQQPHHSVLQSPLKSGGVGSSISKLPLPRPSSSGQRQMNGSTAAGVADESPKQQQLKPMAARRGGDSPYSPDSSDYDDLFEPPPISPGQFGDGAAATQQSDAAGKKSKSGAAQRSKVAEVFEDLFGSSSPVQQMSRNHFAARPQQHNVGGGASGSGMRSRGSANSKPASQQAPTARPSTLRAQQSQGSNSKMNEDQQRLLDDIPGSAVEMHAQDQYLSKLNRLERVVEEVKMVLRPHYSKKYITKDDYKDILRRAVPKINHNRTGEINPKKIKTLIEAYVRKFRHRRKQQH